MHPDARSARIFSAVPGGEIRQPSTGVLVAYRRRTREVRIHSDAIDLQRKHIGTNCGQILVDGLAGMACGLYDSGLKGVG